MGTFVITYIPEYPPTLKILGEVGGGASAPSKFASDKG